ncbi:putative transmembrane transcriptional regulator (anti-sigma factor) [Bosea sp. LC85]|uniref:anti-sigma factor family protein n=1 Tax=Bosea sp. LC85 TaxID=1502851 RepID=UPI0004E3ED5A|nr:anti-sigma factor [Bosea sp. LC85]KFC74794.1 putative transmembrane transcriptional regulator (anti-sigma factor) [Bosea sp. LC85]
MTTRETMSWDLLNAYVDGELEPDQAAEVAAAIAADRETAAKVATLTHLRASMRALPPQEEAPAFALPPQTRPKPRPWLPVAAALLIACGLGMAWFGLSRTGPAASRLTAAVAAHRLWLSQLPPGQGPAAQAQRLGIELAGADVDALPDLSLASLRLVHLSLDPSVRRGGGVLAGYVGPNGCRVGLWIAPADDSLPGRPAAQDREGFAIRAWRGHHASYALIGQGIDPARLDGIAALVARLTEDERSIPREQIAALAEARSLRPACVG